MTQPILASPALEAGEQGKQGARTFLDSGIKKLQSVGKPLTELYISQAAYDDLQQDEAQASQMTPQKNPGVKSSFNLSKPAIAASRRSRIGQLEKRIPFLRGQVIEQLDGLIELLIEKRNELAVQESKSRHPSSQGSPGWSIPD